MMHFLSVDIAGGITPPLDYRSDLEKWIDSIDTDIALLFILLFITICCFALWKMYKTAIKKQNKDEDTSESKDENDKE